MRSRPSWWLVALVVMGLQGVIVGAYFARGKSSVDFARVAPRWVVNYSHRSTIIVPSRFGFGPKTVGRGGADLGYDGQFYLFMALDPLKARYYLDAPAYRFQRPLYPAVSRLIAGGDPSLVPYAMLLVNILAAGVGTAAVALILAKRGHSPWLALLYGLAPGLTLGVHRDLTEPLAFALIVAAVWWLTRDGRQPYIPAGLLFGLAGLTRQPSLAFPAVYAFAQARTDWHRERAKWVPAAAILLLGVLPYVAWVLFLKAWLGAWPNTGAPSFIGPIPFDYLFEQPWALARQPEEIIGVVLPTLLWLGVIIAMRRRMTAALACALVCAMVFVIFATEFSGYPGAGRGMLSVSVPMLLAWPEVIVAGRRVRFAYLAGFAALMIVLPGVILVDLLDVVGPGH